MRRRKCLEMRGFFPQLEIFWIKTKNKNKNNYLLASTVWGWAVPVLGAEWRQQR